MVKRAQLIFILTTMSILLVVFSAIYLGVVGLMQYAHTQFAETSLDETFQAMIITDEAPTDKIVVTNDRVICGEAVLPLQDINLLYNGAKNRLANGGFGRYGSIYFKFYTSPDGTKNVFIAMDLQDTLVNLGRNFTVAFLYLLVIYLMIFTLVWALSYKVFQPIRNTLNKQKRFISDASHELKTPLTIISANADVLKKDEENEQFIENIKSQTSRLDGLVADMLSLAKIDEGRLVIQNETFDISETVTECALPFDALAFEKKKTLSLDIDQGVTFTGDKNSVKKITNILIDNAIKYSTNQVKVKLYRESNKVIALSVYNTGSNIPEKDSEKIFERFYRGDNSRSRESGGSGLGLSIAKSIADANKWKIYAESVLDESMTITVLMKNKNAN